MPPSRVINLEELEQYFNVPEKQVAKSLGVCLTSLKKLCRMHGIHRWPYRKLKSIEKKIHRIVQNTTSEDDISAAQSKLQRLVDEKRKFPFAGQPSSPYGGRKSGSSSSPQNVGNGEFLWSDSSSCSSPAPSSLMGNSSSVPMFAARMQEVGSINEHHMRLSQMQHGFDDFGSSDYSSNSDSCSFSSFDDFGGQPDDTVEDSITYAPFSMLSAADNIFDSSVPVDPFSGSYSSYDMFSYEPHQAFVEDIAAC